MTDIFKDPKAYAEQMLYANAGNVTAAKHSCFEIARTYLQVPAQFLADTYELIDAQGKADAARALHAARTAFWKANPTLLWGELDAAMAAAQQPAERTYAHLPERCPSNHWNDGTDICADCGTDLNPPASRPTFKVMCQQYVERIAAIEVEADTPELARQMVLDSDMMRTAVWTAGDDAYAPDVYAVKDDNNDDVWER